MKTLKLYESITKLIDDGKYGKAADLFLHSTNTNLSIYYDRFDSMPWDHDHQKRNIFKCVLENKNGSYEFEFGDSVKNSCMKEPKINNRDLRIHVYAGMKLRDHDSLSCGLSFEKTVRELDGISSEFIEEKANNLMEQMNKAIIEHNSVLLRKFTREYCTSHNLLINTHEDNGMFIQVVSKAIKKELKRLSEEQDYSLEKQKKEISSPSIYDILSCLSINYFDSVDSVIETFGSMKPSQAIAIFDQDIELQRLFDDEQASSLNAIV